MSVLQADLSTISLPQVKQNRIVFVDGVYSRGLSGFLDKAAGLRAEPFAQDGENGFLLAIPDKVILDHPVHLLLVSSDEPPVEESGVRLKVEAGVSTRLKLIVNQTALSDKPTQARFSSEIRLAANACVKIIHIRRGGEQARRSSTNRFFLGSHSDLEHFSFTEGGASTSSDSVIEFNAEHAFASFKGLSVLHGASVVRDRIIADHRQPRGTSRQIYKNILMGSARSEFRSLVAISRGAVRSDSKQLNKNLLLSNGARAESRPELKIDNDDVSAVHGATVGRIDKDELFYLRSRGLSEKLARYVMTLGFAEEILEEVEPAELKAEVRALVKDQIKAALGFEPKGGG